MAAAQFSNILGLSDPCNKALGQLFMGGPAANCLNTLGLLNVITTPSGQSWVGPFDSYLTATCSQPACANDTISAAIASLKDGCASDLAAKNWSPDDISTILTKASGYYPATREVMCLRDTGYNQALCITTTLSKIEAMVGQPLNIGTLVAETPGVLRSRYPFGFPLFALMNPPRS
ncbi:hypothetical protein FRC10_004568 [Ceratobasidium sp. 414]|nr:hypothetical protein FRC10_004568 [Ceratobasidium sp. 414]